MAETSVRLGLPLLVPGQGQKDVTHNEALAVLDMLVQPVAQSRELSVPPTSPEVGHCWLAPQDATGAWSGREGQLACWTAGGWRYAAPSDGWQIWLVDEAVLVRRHLGEWNPVASWAVSGEAIPVPNGGAVVDVEARLAIEALLGRLSAMGLMEASAVE